MSPRTGTLASSPAHKNATIRSTSGDYGDAPIFMPKKCIMEPSLSISCFGAPGVSNYPLIWITLMTLKAAYFLWSCWRFFVGGSGSSSVWRQSGVCSHLRDRRSYGLTRFLVQFAAIVVLLLTIFYWASTPTAGVSMTTETIYNMLLGRRLFSIDSVEYSGQSMRS
jgi:hypothetical protein